MTSPINTPSSPRLWRDTRRVVWLLSLLLVLTSPLRAERGALILLHTNDTHGQLHPTDAPEDLGGMARRAALVRRERERARSAGDTVLLFDAGDVNTGTFESDEAGGLLDLTLMNAMGYDAMAVGNHEFDLRQPGLEAFRAAAAFPLLSANIRDQHLRRVFSPSTVIERGGWKVGVIGLTSPGTPRTSTFGRLYPWRFLRAEQEFERALRDLPPVDVVVVLSHLGGGGDYALTQKFQGRFLAWMGGHSHDPHHAPLKGYAAYSRTGSKGRFLGRIVIRDHDGGPRAERPQVIRVDASIPPDPSIEKLLPEQPASPVIGIATAPISKFTPSGDVASSALGNLLTDALRVQGRVDIAVANRGGLRRSLPIGPLDERQLYGVCPFKNLFLRFTLTGSQVESIFEQALLFGPGSNAFLEMSGARIEVRKDSLEVWVGDEPLDPTRRYTFGISDFLAYGGDGYSVFREFPEPEVLEVVPAVMLQDYVRAQRVITPDLYPRVRFLEQVGAGQ